MKNLTENFDKFSVFEDWYFEDFKVWRLPHLPLAYALGPTKLIEKEKKLRQFR